MDLQTIFLSIVICIVVALLVYFITVCSIREKTFEEVMEEQRLRHEELAHKPKEKKPKKEKTFKKKAKSTEKITEAKVTEDTAEQVKVTENKNVKASKNDKLDKMVEIELDPEIIAPSETENKKEVKKEGKKSKQPKSILHNKDEKSLVTSNMAVEETFLPDRLPKDFVELKYAEKKKTKEHKEGKDKRDEGHVKERKDKEVVKETKVTTHVTEKVTEERVVATTAMKTKKAKSADTVDAAGKYLSVLLFDRFISKEGFLPKVCSPTGALCYLAFFC